MNNKLSPRQKKFCREYIKDFNGAQAATRAGYSEKTGRIQASQLLTNPNIQAYVAELTKKATQKAELTVESVLADIAAIKARCMRAEPVLDREGEPTGEFIFKEHGALKACELEGRYLAMFTDKMKLGGDKDNPQKIKFKVEIIKPKTATTE
jgi:phage terminase small subunit